MNHTMKEDTEMFGKLQKSMDMLRHTSVEVGLPENASARNKFLLALHQRGSPIMNIPPRPVVEPALSSDTARETISKGLLSACKAAAEGDCSGIVKGFGEAGQAGVDAIHSYIDSGISPPNAPVTVHGGWVYNKVARVSVKVEGKGFNKPMYATGELYGAFTWKVKD